MNLNSQGCHIYGNLVGFELNGNPDLKVISDSPYLWLKTSKYEICSLGFSEKACQGSFISEGPMKS